MRRSLLIDANLLVLLVVGWTDKSYLGRHDCLASYDAKDLEILEGLISDSAGVAVTSHVLTEASNLARQIKEPLKTEVTRTLASLIERCNEIVVPGKVLILRNEYRWLGVTDAALLSIDPEQFTLVTADASLYIAAARANHPTINFNHLRDLRPDFQP